jgi:hypothetical protein
LEAEKSTLVGTEQKSETPPMYNSLLPLGMPSYSAVLFLLNLSSRLIILLLLLALLLLRFLLLLMLLPLT